MMCEEDLSCVGRATCQRQDWTTSLWVGLAITMRIFNIVTDCTVTDITASPPELRSLYTERFAYLPGLLPSYIYVL